MNSMPKMLHKSVAVLLAFCLMLSMSVAAFADETPSCGQAAAEATVDEAVSYCDQAAVVVDVVVEYALGQYADVIRDAAKDPEGYRNMGVMVITVELKDRPETVAQAGFDPNSEEDLELLAGEVYDVAIAFYLDAEAHGEAVAEENATKEVVRFALVEVDGYAEDVAVEKAAFYYELNKMVASEGKDAAVAHAMSLQEHTYEDGVCTECGAEGDSHTPGDINGDGKVNNKDLTRLFQYLSDWDVEVVEEALDVNGDGKTNNKDLTRLFQYLSDWDVEIH